MSFLLFTVRIDQLSIDGACSLKHVPSFHSCFHIPHPRGAKRATQEKAAADERKWLRLEKSLGEAERQRRGASLLDEDDTSEGGDSESNTDEDLKVLRRVLDESQRSGDRVGLSSGCGVACTTDKDGATRKHSALLPLRRPNLKRPCATDDGGQGLSSSVPFGPSLVRLTTSGLEEDVGKKSEAVAIIAA